MSSAAVLRAPTVPETTACALAHATRLASARCLLEAFRQLGLPSTMLDVGCGGGHLVKIAAALGVNSLGLDIAVTPATGDGWDLTRCDLALAEPDAVAFLVAHAFGGPAQLTLCLEVAEHLPAKTADRLCETLAASTERTLLFSAATPGQGGAGHVNEQPHEYWVTKLTALGFALDRVSTEALRRAFAAVAPEAWWYSRNALVCRKETT